MNEQNLYQNDRDPVRVNYHRVIAHIVPSTSTREITIDDLATAPAVAYAVPGAPDDDKSTVLVRTLEAIGTGRYMFEAVLVICPHGAVDDTIDWAYHNLYVDVPVLVIGADDEDHLPYSLAAVEVVISERGPEHDAALRAALPGTLVLGSRS